jgi:hypothetical protein
MKIGKLFKQLSSWVRRRRSGSRPAQQYGGTIPERRGSVRLDPRALMPGIDWQQRQQYRW